jgi:hypothetical protein
LKRNGGGNANPGDPNSNSCHSIEYSGLFNKVGQGQCIRKSATNSRLDFNLFTYQGRLSLQECKEKCQLLGNQCVAINYSRSREECYSLKRDALSDYTGNCKGDLTQNCYVKNMSFESQCKSFFSEFDTRDECRAEKIK